MSTNTCKELTFSLLEKNKESLIRRCYPPFSEGTLAKILSSVKADYYLVSREGRQVGGFVTWGNSVLQNREEIRIIGAVMVEGNQDNILRSSDGLLEKGDDGPAPEDSVPICPKCLRECDPRTYYCPHCDSNEAIDPLASYMPFVDIRFVCGFYGKAWRTIWYNKEASAVRKLLCLVLIIYFAPFCL